MFSGWSSLHDPPIPLGSMWSGTMSLYSVNSMWQMAHFRFCSTIFRFSSFRISARDRSSRYPLGWCESSMRCTPNLICLFSFLTASRPQQYRDLCTGQYSLRRSLMASSVVTNIELVKSVVVIQGRCDTRYREVNSMGVKRSR